MFKSTDHPPRDLENAFNTFSEVSERLSDAYHTLERRVATLTAELAAARSERLAQLAEKERLADRLQQLLELLPGGVVVLDGEGRVTDCNPAAREFLGAPLQGEPWPAVVQRVMALPGDPGQPLVLRDGRRLSLVSRPLGAAPGEVLLLQDVSETQALQEALARRSRLSAMGEMMARLAHQIRTPLATSLLYLGHLRRPHCSDAERLKCAAKMSAQLGHLNHTVNDMLMFARGGDDEDEDFLLAGVLDELRTAVEARLAAAGGRLLLANGCDKAVLRGNRNALLGALLNLVDNAIDAAGAGVVVHIQVRRVAGGKVELRLRDNGPGIPAALQGRIFEPFFTTRHQGTGLGLAVARAVVLRHRGTVEVESGVESGTCFVLLFPDAGGERLLAGGTAYAAGEAARQQQATGVV
ncbi:MAG TPA: PAS domain-containing sensor histidine kinase [Gammaproteobacteria bacterium]|nr:PAS domain-containing sensor histidine kinase [Gammaproteobacteria bacterium]